eukprot:TRINITY_DN5056_c0_g1_i1.p2 TRINITY_DN5056_c0_g1~~TRINITY_DN5056_c0_g1_i1.p2  ORF type:complete len:143 (-),score=21.23 TRINITY_DN5056_c0_g1_i1:116-544(-)
MFYEIMILRVSQIFEQFKPEDFLSFFMSASRPLIKKREIKRQILQLGILYIPRLIQTQTEKLSQKQKLIYDFFKLLTIFVQDNEKQQINLLEEFKKHKINIDQLINDFGYLQPHKQVEILLESDERQDNQVKNNSSTEQYKQ